MNVLKPFGLKWRFAAAVVALAIWAWGDSTAWAAKPSADPPAEALGEQAAGAKAETESHGGADAGHSADLNPLTLDKLQKDLALWTAVVFVVLFLLLWKFAWGPLSAGLDKRERGIADQIAQAEAANRQARENLAEYERKLAEAKQEVRGILDAARLQAEQMGQEIVAQAKADAAAEQQRMLRQIDAATASALKEIADQAAGLAVELAGKIVGAKLDARAHAKLIETAVAEFTQSRN